MYSPSEHNVIIMMHHVLIMYSSSEHHVIIMMHHVLIMYSSSEHHVIIIPGARFGPPGAHFGPLGPPGPPGLIFGLPRPCSNQHGFESKEINVISK